MYMTNNYMIGVINAINKAAQSAKGKTAHAMLKNRKKLQDELAPFEEARMGIFKKYGEEKDGQIVVTKEGNEEEYAKFDKELVELLNIGFDVDTFTISLDDFQLEFNEGLTLYDYDLIYSVCVKQG